METKDILRSIEETKDLIRRVRTPAGARHYGQPIGTIIVRDKIPSVGRGGGSRRRSSASTGKSPGKASRSRQRATESVTVAEGRVAPEADYQAVEEGSEVDFGVKKKKRWWINPDPKKRQTYYKSEAPFRERVDFDFLNNGTAKQAKKILDDFGVVYKTTPKYKQLAKEADSRRVRNPQHGDWESVGGDSYRDFMVSLAESVRLMESEFPGWSKIHGRIYTESTRNRNNFLAYNFPYMNSRSTDDPKPLKDTKRGMVNDVYLAGDRDLKDKPPTTVQTATVFGPDMLTKLRDEIGSTYKPRVGMDVAHNTGGDGLQFLADGADARIAQMMNTMLHEFGHATTASVSGDIAPDLDDREDVNASHRRWYKEYYAEALMKFYSDNGVFKATGKQPDYEYLADYAKQIDFYANAVDSFEATEDLLNDEEALAAYRRKFKEGQVLTERASEARKASDAHPFTFNGRASDFRPWARTLERLGYIEPGSFDQKALMKIAPSTYAATKPVEIEAESWVSYMLDQEATKGAAEWGRTLHEMMTWYMDDVSNPDFNTTDMEED